MPRHQALQVLQQELQEGKRQLLVTPGEFSGEVGEVFAAYPGVVALSFQL